MRWLTIVFLLFFLELSGQNKQLLYNVDDLPQTLMTNPGANINFDGHLGIPLFSQFHFSVGTSGVNLDDIFGTSNGDINTRVRNTIRRLTKNDHFTATEQLEVLSAGWRLDKDHYLSAGVYQEMDFFSYFPKDPAVLVSEGNRDYINIPFDFSHVAFTAEALMIYHLGLNKKIDHRLTVGGRLKLYSGVFNAESVNNRGTFTTRRTPEGPNYYRHIVDNMNITVNTSGFASLRDNAATVQEATGDILKRSFFGGNIGVGVDVGGSYVVNDRMIVTGSLQDIGVMWQRSDVENYLYYGSYTTDGLEPLFPEIGPDGRSIPYWDIFEDEVDKNLIDETLNESYITWRPIKFNASVQYGFGQSFAPCNYLTPVNRRPTNLVGFHMFGVKRPRTFNYALTAFYDRKISSAIRMKASYTIDDYSFTNVGLLLSTHSKFINFYIAADNLFGYFNLAKTQSQSLQLGVQIILNRS